MNAYALLVLAGCPSPKESTNLQDQIDALTARLDQAEQDISDRDAEIAALEALVNATGDAEIVTRADLADYATTADLEECVTTEELATALSSYASTAYVDSQVEAALADYVTQSDLDSRGYATSTYVDTQVATAIEQAELDAALDDYVTESELDSRDYATNADLDSVRSDLDSLSETAVVVADPTTCAGLSETVADADQLRSALANLDNYRLPDGCVVTIQLDPGTYTFDEALHVAHPDGGRIAIVGNTGDPSLVNMVWTGDSDGIVLSDGQALGYLGGMTLDGSGLGASGLFLQNNASAFVGAIVATGWTNGLEARGNSTVWEPQGRGAFETVGGASVVVSDNAYGVVVQGSSAGYLTSLTSSGGNQYGALVQYGSTLLAGTVTISGASDNALVVQHASSIVSSSTNLVGPESGGDANVDAAYSSSAYLNGLVSSGSAEAGVRARAGSWIEAYDASLLDNHFGAEAYANSGIGCDYCTVEGSVSSGIYAHRDGYVTAVGARTTGNAIGVESTIGSVVDFAGAQSDANDFGTAAYGHSLLYAIDATISGNSVDNSGPPTYADGDSVDAWQSALMLR